MARFFIEDIRTGEVTLPAEISKHLQVLRAKAGEVIELFNGKGLVAKALLKELHKKSALAEVFSLGMTPHTHFHWVLAFSVTSVDKMALIVQKATELGVAALQPLIFKYSQPWPFEKEKRRLEHFTKIIRHACEQCGENWSPDFLSPVPFLDWLQQAKRPLLLLEPTASLSLKNLQAQSDVAFIIGPEGGLADDEKNMAFSQATAVSLGKNILRMETACLAVLAAAHALWDA